MLKPRVAEENLRDADAQWNLGGEGGLQTRSRRSSHEEKKLLVLVLDPHVNALLKGLVEGHVKDAAGMERS